MILFAANLSFLLPPHDAMQQRTEGNESKSCFCFLVIVGGTTMWLQWLIHGMPDAPRATEEVREQGKGREGKGVCKRGREGCV